MKLSPAGRRILYWLLAALWTAIIYLTLPYAPVWRDWLTDKFSGYFIPITVLVLLLLVLVFTLIRMIRSRSSLQDYIFFAILIAAYWYSLSRIEILIEQVHFLEYGLLAYLVILALRVDRRDPGGYLIAGLLVALIGIGDEYIQGLLPNRVGEMRDIYLNALSGLLALCWFRLCIKPTETRPNSYSTSLAAMPIVGIIALSIGIFNSRISEFGYYLEDPNIGGFYTRQPLDEIGRVFPQSDYFRSEISPKLYRTSYSELLHIVENPLHGEVLVHIFRRDKHLQRENYIVAHWENQILEKYFYGYFQGSEHQWDSAKQAEIKSLAAEQLDEPYVSPVSEHIITSFSSAEQWVIISVIEFIVLLTMVFTLRKWRKVKMLQQAMNNCFKANDSFNQILNTKNN